MSVTEAWRPIPGHPGYEVSDLGNVISRRRPRPCALKPKVGPKGYRTVVLWETCFASKTIPVHRLVTLAFRGPCPEGLEVRHLDGDKANNAASNLAYGTSAENAADQVRHGVHRQTQKTHCPAGHPYDGVSGRRWQGHRYCRICRTAHQAAYRERQANATPS